ncbi:amidohydrolase [Myxococcus sp. Y35]|uniref:amidohydrolase n=1 Tax=Pseudomyxococcus flavus TaxID=3115648 RepID=UPI003CF109D1
MFSRFVAVLAVVLASVPALAQQVTLYEHGKVFTGRDDRPFVEAFVVRGGKVAATGSTADLRMLFPTARRVDLQGRTVVPGLVDAHSHVAPLGHPSWFVNDPSFAPGPGPTADEVVALVSARAATVPAGTPILAIVSTAWYATAGEDPRALLDAAAPHHPVVGVDWSGHGNTVNSTMLAMAGYVDGAPHPYGGRLSRDATGRLTGYVQEVAEVAIFKALADLLPTELYAGAYAQYAQDALALGYTTTCDIPFVLSDERAAQVHALQPVAHFLPVCIIDTEGEQCHPGPDGTIRRKVFLDGGPVDCSTHVTVPYVAPETCPAASAPWLGLEDITDAQLDGVLADVLSRGGHLLVHALGNGAVEQLLGRLEAHPSVDWSNRVTLEHGDMVTPAQVARVAALGIPVVQNPTHIPALLPLFPLRYEASLYAEAQPLRSLVTAGIPLAFGSDTFGSPTSPWVDVMLAVAHPGRPSEGITVAEAVTAYTRTAARVRGIPGGYLAAGQPATFAVLSQDVFTAPLEALPLTSSVLTVVDGVTRWSTGALSTP